MKTIVPIIIKPLTLIINHCLNSGIFPDDLKIAKVIPVYKGNDLDKDNVNSYRPISLLPAFSKLFEKKKKFTINYMTTLKNKISYTNINMDYKNNVQLNWQPSNLQIEYSNR